MPTHETVKRELENTRNLERGYYSIALLQVLDLGTDFVHDAHVLMTENVASLKLHDFLVEQVKITTTYSSSCHSDDYILRVCNGRNRSLNYSHV
jgi:hypothetical protein